uniref:Uncharacterized protein n=2 Tax=Prymnesium polylepis TaxID=72548 RepID=A0A6T7WPS6_9EUKA
MPDDGDVAAAAAEGAPEKKKSAEVTVSTEVNNVLTIMFQNTGAVLFRRAGLDLSSLNFRKNVGHVFEALLRRLDLDWSADGKALWWRADGRSSNDALSWQEPKSWRSRMPKETRAGSTLGGLDPAELQHDTSAAGVGSTAARRAADDARLEPPRALEFVKPEAAGRLKRGTGWGNVPRTLTSRCVAEQSCIDSLIVIVQEHAPGMCRKDSEERPHGWARSTLAPGHVHTHRNISHRQVGTGQKTALAIITRNFS